MPLLWTEVHFEGRTVKKLLLIILMTGLALLPLACADRNFDSPINPALDPGSSSANPTPTP
jgi:hypothetical protein